MIGFGNGIRFVVLDCLELICGGLVFCCVEFELVRYLIRFVDLLGCFGFGLYVFSILLCWLVVVWGLNVCGW